MTTSTLIVLAALLTVLFILATIAVFLMTCIVKNKIKIETLQANMRKMQEPNASLLARGHNED